MLVLTHRGWVRWDCLTPLDEVACVDENDPFGRIVWKRVEEIFETDAPILHVHLDGGKVLPTTHGHPIYTLQKGWIEAKDLQAGDLLLTEKKEWKVVEEVYDPGVEEKVYNCSVEDYHTYFVGLPGWGFGIWAHNAYTVTQNQKAGKTREKAVASELKRKHPNASVQRERYLRDAEGNIVRDPLTGKGRRIDVVVIEDQKVIKSVEVTSRTAPKAEQVARENRVRQAGGTYIRDRITRALLDMSGILTRIFRRK